MSINQDVQEPASLQKGSHPNYTIQDCLYGAHGNPLCTMIYMAYH